MLAGAAALTAARPAYLTANVETNVSLKDVLENPQNYLGERECTLRLVMLTLREDPYHRLAEEYYLAHVRDTYDYETSFVIPHDDYANYQEYVGKYAEFKLRGKIGPGLMHPPDKLVTNVLTSKALDPYSGEFATVFIILVGPAETPQAKWTTAIFRSPSLTIVVLCGAIVATVLGLYFLGRGQSTMRVKPTQ